MTNDLSDFCKKEDIRKQRMPLPLKAHMRKQYRQSQLRNDTLVSIHFGFYISFAAFAKMLLAFVIFGVIRAAGDNSISSAACGQARASNNFAREKN